MRTICIHKLIFTDYAALVTTCVTSQLIKKFTKVCGNFGLIINLKKTKVLVQGTSASPCIMIYVSSITVVNDFIYLWSTITNNLSLDDKKSSCIAKAAGAMARLCDCVVDNSYLSKTKVLVY